MYGSFFKSHYWKHGPHNSPHNALHSTTHPFTTRHIDNPVVVSVCCLWYLLLYPILSVSPDRKQCNLYIGMRLGVLASLLTWLSQNTNLAIPEFLRQEHNCGLIYRMESSSLLLGVQSAYSVFAVCFANYIFVRGFRDTRVFMNYFFFVYKVQVWTIALQTLTKLMNSIVDLTVDSQQWRALEGQSIGSLHLRVLTIKIWRRD